MTPRKGPQKHHDFDTPADIPYGFLGWDDPPIFGTLGAPKGAPVVVHYHQGRIDRDYPPEMRQN